MENKIITKTNQSLSDIFDVEPTIYDVVTVSEPVIAAEKPLDTDFEIARTTMHNMLLKGQSAVENALLIANGNEEADSYNAVSTLIKTMTDASIKLMGLHEINAKVLKPVPGAATVIPLPESGAAVNISGPVFCGTTSELSKMVMEQRKLTTNI